MGKVAPQVVGQIQPVKLCSILNIDYISDLFLKNYIQENVDVLFKLVYDYTFDCPNIYYNQPKDTVSFITLNENIDWSLYSYKWTCPYKEWNNSSTLKISTQDGDISLMEIQFHSKSRTNMAIRWFYDNFIDVFRDKLNIVDL